MVIIYRRQFHSKVLKHGQKDSQTERDVVMTSSGQEYLGGLSSGRLVGMDIDVHLCKVIVYVA